MSDLTLPFIEAASYGGVFPLPAHIRVIHSTEGPMSRGNARALARNWFGSPQAGTSAHDMFDPSEGVKMVPDNHIAWHVGPGGNGISRGTEHCGRVSLTKEQWLSADGKEMLDRSARYNAAAAHRDGVLPRWLSLTQLRRREPGFCTHNDVRLALGGTTHTDPGPNFPYAWYMQRVQMYYNGLQEDDVTPEEIQKNLRAVFSARRVTGKATPYEALESIPGLGAKLDAHTKLLTEIRDLLKPVPPVPGK